MLFAHRVGGEMKKVLLSIISIFFCLGALVGGGLLLTGCDSPSSQTQPLEPGGGFDESQNDAENGENQGDFDTDIGNSGETSDKGDESVEDATDDDDDVHAMATFNIVIKITSGQGHGNVGYGTNSTATRTTRTNLSTTVGGVVLSIKANPDSGYKASITGTRYYYYNSSGTLTYSTSYPSNYKSSGYGTVNYSVSFSEIPEPSSYYVTIKYSSSSKVPYGSKLNVHVDGAQRTSVSRGGTVTILVDPGSHTILGTPTNTGDAHCETRCGSSTNYGYVAVTVSSATTLTFTAYARRYIYYDGNGSTSGSTSTTSAYYGDDATVASNGFSRTNYDFSYWSTSSSGGTRYDPGDKYTDLTSDVTLYARWSARYTWETITYKANYPNGTTATYTQDVRSDSSVGILSASECGFSTPSGYTWSHWNTNSSGTGVNWYDYETWSGSRGSDTLYAIWSRSSYTNRYYYRNSSGSTTSTTQTRYYGSTFYMYDESDISEYTSYGWTLDGWATTSSSTTSSYSPGQSRSSTSTSTLSYYAISRRTVYLSYDSNGGSSVSSTTGTQYWNQYGGNKTNPSLTVTSTTPTRTGYNFLGWSTSSSATSASYDGGDSYTFSNAYNASSTAKLYAVWEAKVIAVNLNKNGGAGGTSTIYLKYDSGWYSSSSCTSSSKITSLPSTPTRTGYEFLGYNTESNGSGATAVSATGSINLSDTYYSTDGTRTWYAVWEARNPAYYDSEGGFWYVENGKLPQSKVSDSLKSTLSGQWSSLSDGSVYYMGVEELADGDLTTDGGMQSKVHNGNEYVKFNGEYYLVEPIRWRLVYSSSQQEGHAVENTSVLATMAEIVFVGSYSSAKIGVGAGYSAESVTMLLKNQVSTEFLVNESREVEIFRAPKDTTTASGSVFVASSEELANFTTSKNNTTGSGVKAGKVSLSDFVRDYLRATGQGDYYFTRDLGDQLNTILCLNPVGDRSQAKAQQTLGVQFTVKVTEFACKSV